MRSGSSVAVTLIWTLLKPGELIESVPYVLVLNTVKFPVSSVVVRVVLPFVSNSTVAFVIAAPFWSQTIPLIFPCCCWPDAHIIAHTLQIKTNAKRCLLVHESFDRVLFLTTAINALRSVSALISVQATLIPSRTTTGDPIARRLYVPVCLYT